MIFCIIQEIFGSSHFIEVCKELIDFFGNKVMSEYKNLIVCPDIIERCDKLVSILAIFADRSYLLCDISIDEILDVISNKCINLDFFLSRWLALLVESVYKPE